MREIRYRLTALADLAHIHAHIGEDDPNAAASVVRRIRGAAKRLELFPNSGRIGTVLDTFELVIPGLPYIAVYLFNDDVIDIVVVFHSSQDG